MLKPISCATKVLCKEQWNHRRSRCNIHYQQEVTIRKINIRAGFFVLGGTNPPEQDAHPIFYQNFPTLQKIKNFHAEILFVDLLLYSAKFAKEVW